MSVSTSYLYPNEWTSPQQAGLEFIALPETSPKDFMSVSTSYLYPNEWTSPQQAGLEFIALSETSPFVEMPLLAPPENSINSEFIGKWFHCLQVAAESTKRPEKRPYIYRIVNDGKMSLGLMTPKKAAAFHRMGGENQLCEKLSFSEVIQVTRHFIAGNQDSDYAKKTVSVALTAMAAKADAKYSGFKGIIRRITSIFHNFLLTDVVVLFSEPRRYQFTNTKPDTSNFPSLSNNTFWGSDAKLARLVVRHYC
jgi:hypothetical protein